MNNNGFNDSQNTGSVPQPPMQQPAQQPYTVNNVPVQQPQPQQYQQPAQPAPPQNQTPVPKDPGHNMGTASLILGLVSIFGGFTAIIGLACAIAGLVCGKKSKDATTAVGREPIVRVELWDEAETNLLNKHAFDVDGYESRSFTFNVPKNQSYKVKVTSKSDYKVTVKSAYYRSREWSEGKRTLTNSSKEKSYVKSFNNQGVDLQFTFNQVKGNTTLSWPRDLNLPKDATMYIYRTILNEDGSYAGNREELGYTTKNTFQDNADRGMELGKKYRYEIVALSKEWIDNGFKVPADPETLPDCNSAACSCELI